MPKPTDVVADFGAVAFQNEFSIVRIKSVKHNGGWRTKITVHKKAAGEEQLPKGYILGHNMLWFDDN